MRFITAVLGGSLPCGSEATLAAFRLWLQRRERGSKHALGLIRHIARLAEILQYIQ